METLEELRKQKRQAESNLTSYQSQLNLLNEKYERLQTARDKIKNKETEFFTQYESAQIYTKNIASGDWEGETREQYEERIYETHRQAVGTIVYDVCMDIETIEALMNQMQNQAESINDSIRYWSRQVNGYQNRIEWRIRFNGDD